MAPQTLTLGAGCAVSARLSRRSPAKGIYPALAAGPRHQGRRRCHLASGAFPGVSLVVGHPVREHAFQRRIRKKGPSQATCASLDAFVVGFEGVVWDEASGGIPKEAREALGSTSNPFYVISSAPAEKVSQALKEGCHVDIPADSPRLLVSATSADKLSLLRQVNARPIAQDPSNSLHYVDADMAALEAVSQDPAFSKWKLYLASWSCTGGGASAGAKSITLKDFPELLKWGLLMGVNDGCQEYEDGTPAT